MTWAHRALTGAAALLACLMALGFILFATSAMRTARMDAPVADGIVVLTGGGLRIGEAARLLSTGHGRRLLITGVNRRTSRKDLIRLSGLSARQFDCCVDVGYGALDTVGNADETRAWAREHGFRRLIVVTSSYHMPRSLAELALEMPDLGLVPHPVRPKSFRSAAWWLDPRATRLLAAEYMKYLPAAFRLAVARMAWPWGEGSIATADGRRTRI